MTAATTFVPTRELAVLAHVGFLGFPMAASKQIYGGCLAGINSSGQAVDAGDSTCVQIIGRADASVDNSSGNAGDKSANIQLGIFAWKNQDSIAASDIGSLAYFYDNQTVCKAPAASALLVGKIVAVDTNLGPGQVAVAMYGALTNAPKIQFGTTTLVSGTKDVQTAGLKSSSCIFLTMRDPGAGALTEMAALDAPVASRNATTGVFTINCIDDTSSAVITTAVPTVDWMVVTPA